MYFTLAYDANVESVFQVAEVAYVFSEKLWDDLCFLKVPSPVVF